MSKYFDATIKGLLECGPADWVALAGFPGRTAEIVDADVSTVSAATDKVIRVNDPKPWFLDVNFQTGPDASLPRRVHLYSSLLHSRHELPVRSVVILLSRDANLSVIDGHFQLSFPGESPYLEFRYDVIRVWELDPERLLRGPLSLVPLAPVSAVRKTELPRVVREVAERLEIDGGDRAPEMWAASSILMGLKYEEAFIDRLLVEVQAMAESVTFKVLEDRGSLKTVQKTLLHQGTVLLGEPPDAIREKIMGTRITDLPRFDDLLLRLLKVNSWDELMADPVPPKKPAKRKKPKA